MKIIFISLICIVFFSAADCRKKVSDNCHYYFTIKNNSSDTIIVAMKWTNNSMCNLEGDKTLPDSNFYLSSGRDCWEDYLTYKNDKTQEVFIVDPKNYNNPQVFYDCDSIPIKNKIFKKYSLTIDSLRKYNFHIVYQ